jgi:glycosyltransferase involved in cell wall biosynthesis
VLVLAGPDDQGLRGDLEALARELGIASRVVFTGMLYRDDRLAALSAATVWALPSHSENFAVAAMEALAAGLPVVVSPGVNLAPRLRASGAAVVAEATPERFAQALDALLGDPARRDELGRAAQEFASAYAWSRIAELTLRTYENLLEGAS